LNSGILIPKFDNLISATNYTFTTEDISV